MTTKINSFGEDSLAALKRDHERLRYEVRQMRTMLRAFMSTMPDLGKRTFCRFVLVNALTTSEASETATIMQQYGPGVDHDASSSIVVHNLLSHGAGVYVFQGDAGDAGYAFYDSRERKWYIVQMECP